MSDLTYKDNQIYMEGIIVEISDGAVGIEFNGRLGCMKYRYLNKYRRWNAPSIINFKLHMML